MNRALWILVLALMMATSSWFVSDDFAQEGFPPPDDLGRAPLTPPTSSSPKGEGLPLASHPPG